MICEFYTDAGECGLTAVTEIDGEGRCMIHLADWIARQMVRGERLETEGDDIDSPSHR